MLNELSISATTLFRSIGLLFILSFSSPCYLFAQIDSTRLLPVYTLTEHRQEIFSAGLTTVVPDSQLVKISLSRTISELLSDQNQIYVRNYGPGSLSTLSVRGLGSQQTAVVWNGFQLQNPSLGLIDLSVLPVVASGKIRFQPGALCSLFGSGASGGALFIDQMPVYNNGFSISSGFAAGSFSRYSAFLTTAYSNSTLSVKATAYMDRAKNNFPFVDYLGGMQQIRLMPNASVNQSGAMATLAFRHNKSGEIIANVWFHRAQRELPPVLSVPVSAASQRDQGFRNALEWSYKFIRIRTALLLDQIYYKDTLSGFESFSNSLTQTNEAEVFRNFKRVHSIFGGIHQSFSLVHLKNYNSGTASRNRLALLTGYRYRSKNKRLRATVNGRLEWVDRKFLPPSFSVGTDWTVNENISLRANAARIYRIPTLNDLYWYPGGNPELKPESGWSQEAGVHWFKKVSSTGLTFIADMAVYHTLLYQRIVWLPSFGNPWWTPVNVNTNRILGADVSGSIEWNNRNWFVSLCVSAQYVNSTTPDLYNGKSRVMMYTPQWLSSGSFSVGWKGYIISVRNQYTGKRYTTSDNSASLPGFNLLSLSFQKEFKIPIPVNKFTPRKPVLLLFGRCDNLLNTSYQNVQSRPMPGRNWQAGINITI